MRSATTARRTSRRKLLSFEQLEDRCLLASSVLTAAVPAVSPASTTATVAAAPATVASVQLQIANQAGVEFTLTFNANGTLSITSTNAGQAANNGTTNGNGASGTQATNTAILLFSESGTRQTERIEAVIDTNTTSTTQANDLTASLNARAVTDAVLLNARTANGNPFGQATTRITFEDGPRNSGTEGQLFRLPEVMGRDLPHGTDPAPLFAEPLPLEGKGVLAPFAPSAPKAPGKEEGSLFQPPALPFHGTDDTMPLASVLALLHRGGQRSDETPAVVAPAATERPAVPPLSEAEETAALRQGPLQEDLLNDTARLDLTALRLEVQTYLDHLANRGQDAFNGANAYAWVLGMAAASQLANEMGRKDVGADAMNCPLPKAHEKW